MHARGRNFSSDSDASTTGENGRAGANACDSSARPGCKAGTGANSSRSANTGDAAESSRKR